MERWLLTYADMITLLLALFIVLFAMSTVDVVRFDALRRTLAESFRGQVMTEPGSVLDGAPDPLHPDAASQEQTPSAAQQQKQSAAVIGSGLTAKSKKIQAEVSKAGVSAKNVDVTVNQRGLVIRLAGDAFFASGSAALKPEMQRDLKIIASQLASEHRPISVEGHTDGQPIAGGGQFSSNQALSAMRAISVWAFLREAGITDEQLHQTVGYGSRFPLEQVTPFTKASAKNRRVEIVLLGPGGNTVEPGEDQPFDLPAPSEVKRGGGSAAPVGQLIEPIVAISEL